ncbi:sulfatase family protein [Tautonia rosea]|uniref:sulfatase family protein n=1 Tax=Tautonia rosea TaxID=2728037 RepID=UPI001475F96F|nr:sulfatase-like hydrolase/transferase [Tautonia rosea]
MRIMFLSCLLAATGVVQAEGPAQSPEGEDDRQPNVVLIFTDDQGTIDAGCYGADDLTTPAIDALASRGVRFTQFYAAAPVCSPSRAGLLTGRYPIRAGVPGNVSSTRGVPGMPTEQVTIAEVFREAGYATGHVGKWHLGYSPETMPRGQGFDSSFGHMGGCIDNYSHFFYWAGPNRHDLWDDGEEVHRPGRFFPDLMVERAETFIEEHRDRPFFLYFALNMPHYPYQGEPEWLDHYADLPEPRRQYAAFVSTLDARVGRLMEAIDRLGLTEETIVVFQSDHGHSTEERAFFGGGSAGPYRGAKFSLFEGGIRVPAIVRWPGHLPEGETRDQVALGCDWLPTLMDLCGIEDNRLDLDGMSLAPVLRDPDAPSPHEVVHWKVGRGSGAQWAVRQGRWKLIGNPRDTTNGANPIPDLGPRFLVNLEEDPGERVNRIEDQPEIARKLEARHEDWLRSADSDAN